MPSLPFDESATFNPPPAFGPYRVLHQIGSGVLGPVFRTYDPQADRLVAVKVFRLDLIPEDVARLTEGLRRLVGGAGYLAAGLEGATAWAATDYHAAETLDVLLRHLAPATIESAAPLLRAMAMAIDNAWAGGASFGHGALHPRDIFVTPGTGDVSISGFGIARALESVGAKAPVRRPYTAPERAAGDAWDIRADVFSLGAIAHELLTGRRPAGPGEQDGALPAARSPEDRVRIRRVLSKALAERPAERFATAGDLIDALENPLWSIDLVPPAAAVTSAESPRETLTETLTDTSPSLPAAIEPIDVPRSPRPQMRTPRAPVRIVDREPAAAPVEPRVVVPNIADAPIHEPMSADLTARPESRPMGAAPPMPLPGAVPWTALCAAIVAALVLGAAVDHQYLCSQHPGLCTAAPAVAPAPAAATTRAPVTAAASASTDTEVPVEPSAPTSAAPAPTAPLLTPKSSPAPAGRLSVKSTPSAASVTIDGRLAGKTPLTVSDLSLATHTISVTRAGFVTEDRKVALTRRAPSAALVVTLKFDRRAGASAGATTGSVSVDSRPRGARVTMDGRNLGVTPLSVPGVSLGTHIVRVELAGHKPVTTPVTVKAGETARIAVTLEQR